MMTTTLAAPDARLDANSGPAFRTWFRADWVEVLFLHYAIEPHLLQPHVPFDLDLHEGKAWVSLVAFTQSKLRPAAGGAFTSWTTLPVRHHEFLNLRTYVKVEGRRAIYFLTEWIPNLCSYVTGPAMYGLPFRLAGMRYETAVRSVIANRATFRVEQLPDTGGAPTQSDSNLRFLLEQYTATTCRRGVARMFHIAHEPWPARPASVRVTDDSLIRQAAPWFADARFMSAHSSPGVSDVSIGRPIRIETAFPVEKPNFLLGTWTPLLVLPMLALFARPLLPSWAYMWAIAVSLFAGAKWATWRQAAGHAARAPRWKSLAYLLAWPGMDAKAFLGEKTAAPSRVVAPWVNIVAGALCLFGLPRMLSHNPLLAGWAGMIGLILLLHFGTFHILALLWQRIGVNAQPIMNSPWRSRTLGEFWGQRWNRGFRDLSHGWLFRPLLPLVGPFGATYVTFVVSGLVHDLVISAPAGAGFLLPTLYFLFQAAGVLVERTPFAKRLLRGFAGRLFTIAVVAAPAPLLFHSPFVLNVIVPFLRTIHAL